MFVDGFEAQAPGFAAPAIIEDWKIPRASMGLVFGATNFILQLAFLQAQTTDIAALQQQIQKNPDDPTSAAKACRFRASWVRAACAPARG